MSPSTIIVIVLDILHTLFMSLELLFSAIKLKKKMIQKSMLLNSSFLEETSF